MHLFAFELFVPVVLFFNFIWVTSSTYTFLVHWFMWERGFFWMFTFCKFCKFSKFIDMNKQNKTRITDFKVVYSLFSLCSWNHMTASTCRRSLTSKATRGLWRRDYSASWATTTTTCPCMPSRAWCDTITITTTTATTTITAYVTTDTTSSQPILCMLSQE